MVGEDLPRWNPQYRPLPPPARPSTKKSATFAKKKGKNERRCNKKTKGRCFWDQGYCKTILDRTPTPEPTESPTNSPTRVPTEQDDEYSGSLYSSGYSGSDYYSSGASQCTEYGPTDCYSDMNCNWDLDADECTQAPAKCYKFSSRNDCSDKDGCVWDTYYEQCNTEILEDWCTMYTDSKKKCSKQGGGDCAWQDNSCQTKNHCYLYSGESLCSEDSDCEWYKDDYEEGMEWCDKVYDDCNVWVNKKQCKKFGGSSCYWDKKERLCAST